jgi:hypothetical protein
LSETAAPPAPEAPASTPDPATIALTEANRAIDEDTSDPAADEAAKATNEAAEATKKPEKSPEQRRIDQLQRAVDRKTRQLAEFRAREGLSRQQQAPDNRASADDSEPLSLSRAELDELVNKRAAELAPTLSEQAAEAKRRKGVVEGLAKTWGQERFDELASDLDDSFGGLADSHGRPKPATEAVFEADDPKAVIEYLADPEHHDESEAIARMSAVHAGRAIARLEDRLKAEKAKAKPKVSNAPAPLEPVRGAGPAKTALADLEGAAFDAKRREQIKNRR